MADQQTTRNKSQEGFAGKRRQRFSTRNERPEYDHEVLEISRVVRVVKGGRRFRFRASVVIGDRNGKIGFGIGKSRDVQEAIQKAQDQAKKDMITVSLAEGTIPYEVRAKFKGADVLLRPARTGTGVIAGGIVRAVADLAGIKDLVSKVYGSSNRISNVRATMKALESLRPLKKKAKA